MKRTETPRINLTADDGKVITDGTNYATTIYPADGADLSIYSEITIAEYKEIEAAAMSAELAEENPL